MFFGGARFFRNRFITIRKQSASFDPENPSIASPSGVLSTIPPSQKLAPLTGVAEMPAAGCRSPGYGADRSRSWLRLVRPIAKADQFAGGHINRGDDKSSRAAVQQIEVDVLLQRSEHGIGAVVVCPVEEIPEIGSRRIKAGHTETMRGYGSRPSPAASAFPATDPTTGTGGACARRPGRWHRRHRPH